MIQPGQTYYSADGDHSSGGPRRIKVVGEPVSIAGLYHSGKVAVVTLTMDGREIRRRAIEVTQLHTTATTRDGAPRRTGYVREDT